MQRFKFLACLTLLTVTLLAVSLGAGKEGPSAESKDDRFGNALQTKQPDPRLAALYERQKEELEEAVAAYFKKAIASGDIVGAGVSIVQGDSVLLSGGFGSRNSNAGDRVNGQTIFRLGSLSKGFTGILAARLISEGQLHLEDKVNDFIPGFRLGNQNNTEKITLANLLSHTSGAPYHSYTNLIEAGLPLLDIAQRFQEVAPVASPGSMYSYQNALFALSSEMMRAVTGQQIDQLLKDRFFKPLGMGTAVMDYESLALAENVAVPHVKGRRGWVPGKLNHSYYNAIAAGGINASPLDMAKWMRFLLGHNPEVMGKAALESAFMPVVEIKGHAKYYHRWPGHLASYYGYGWRIHRFAEAGTAQERTIWHHGGSVNNFRNEIALYPESDLGICVLLNSNSSLAKTVIPDLYEIVQDIYRQPAEYLALNNLPEKDSN